MYEWENNLYLECICGGDEHRLVFSKAGVDSFDPYTLLYVNHFLEEKPFFQRLWLGVKYIFGYKCRYGHFQETLLPYQSVAKLKELCEQVLNDYKE